MTRRLTPHHRFTAVALGAMMAAFVIAGTAAAQTRPAAAGATATATAAAQAHGIDAVNVEALKKHYLECERASTRGELDRDDIMACSVVYEVVKQRAFGGSYDALHAWWRQTRDRTAR